MKNISIIRIIRWTIAWMIGLTLFMYITYGGIASAAIGDRLMRGIT